MKKLFGAFFVINGIETNMKNWLRFLIVLLIGIGFSIYFIIDYVLPYSPIKPYRVNVITLKEFENGHLPSNFGLKFDDLKIITSDSLSLSGYYIHAENAKATMILIHGIADCKEHFYNFCKKLQSIQCNSLIIDMRAHGQSEGEYCTFGYKEKYDVSQIINYLEKHYNDSIIGIYGSSFGGAVALQAMALDSRIKFGIIESTFHDFEAVVNEYFKNIAGFYSKKIVKRSLTKSGNIADFDPFTIKPYIDCKKIHQPIIIAHGTDDKNIPIEFSKINFENLSSIDKTYIPVQGAGHLNLHQFGGSQYWEKISTKIIQWID